MKKEDCTMCGKYQAGYYCPTGKHVYEPGKIHSGRGAVSDAQWDCPNCRGAGFILVSILDRICLALYRRGRKVDVKLHPKSH